MIKEIVISLHPLQQLHELPVRRWGVWEILLISNIQETAEIQTDLNRRDYLWLS